MAIRFRCSECNQLMSIGSRMAGQMVECPSCGEETLVPLEEADVAAPAPVADDAERADDTVEEHVVESSDSDIDFLDDEAEAGDSPTTETPPLELAPPAAVVGSQTEAEWDEDEEDGPLIRRAETELEDMDLTPMVDVTFLLLIFFMITASFSLHKTIEVPTPDPEEQGATQSIQKIDDLLDDSIKVDIDDRDIITIDDEPLANPEALVDTLRDKMRSDQKVELLLRASSAARHGTVVAVVDAGNAVGMQSIRMVVTGDDSD